MTNPYLSRYFGHLWNAADAAGMEAGGQLATAPMVVQNVDIVGNVSGPKYHVSEGECGFAWLTLKGNTPFGRWAKASGIATSCYTGGLTIRCRAFGQSMQRKEAWAQAAMRHLRTHGRYTAGAGAGKEYDFQDVWMGSRMD